MSFTEDQFLQGLFPRLGTMPAEVVVPPGDDCAAIRIAPGRLLLLAVDQVVGDRHYHLGRQKAEVGDKQECQEENPAARRHCVTASPCAAGEIRNAKIENSPVPAPTPPELAGRKLLARNLSDIAAMGGRPLYALVAGAFAPGQDAGWLNRFFDGLLALGRETGTVLIGGDLARAPHDAVAALTIVGEVAEERIKLRSAAQSGDVLFVTGQLGSSFETGHHLTFTPRLREGQWLAAQVGVRAMMDISDGLLPDAARVCRASHCGLRIEAARLPLRIAQTTVEKALTDGEDYELLFSVTPAAAEALAAAWPFPGVALTRVGLFTAENCGHVTVVDAAGQEVAPAAAGYDHFR